MPGGRTPPASKAGRGSARPDDPDKYFMVSSDCHANEPASYLADYIESEYRERIPHVEVRADGAQFIDHRRQPAA